MAPKPKITSPVPESVARQIDENLRRIYAAKLSEDIPDQLQELLKQLRDTDATP